LIDSVCQCISEGLGGDEGFDREISELHVDSKSKSQPKAKMIVGSSVFINSPFGPESEIEIHCWTEFPFPTGFKGEAIFIQYVVCFFCVLSLVEERYIRVIGMAVLKSALNIGQIVIHKREFLISEFIREN